MRGLFSKAYPSFDRVLLVESGTREITEKVLHRFYEIENIGRLDVLTCYSGVPRSFDTARGVIYSIHTEAAQSHLRFIRTVLATPYTAVAILSTDSGVLARWKWAVALLTKANVVMIHQEGSFHCAGFWRRIARLISPKPMRIWITDQLRLAAEVLLMPFTISYLLLFAAAVHARRLLRAK